MPKVCPVCDTVYDDANAFCPVDGTTLHVVDLEGGLIGSVVADRYLVTDLLGEGGMGKVYLARHVRLPQQAAIKVLRPEMVRDPAAVARFNREASNASRIDDENVARVYDFGEASGGTVYLAMEYVAGRTLRDVITKDGALEPRRAAELVEQIARGLDAAHRLKIIHRDLKPDNVLVTVSADGRERVKVVDFGIAKAFGADDGGLTKTGFVVGTPEFMSPEQLLGGALDARSDVYALALLAFQCFTGSLPFPGDTPEQAMTARLTSQPRALADVSGKDWPLALQEAFDAGLSRDVSKRTPSAGEFARRLKAAVEDWTPSQVGRAGATKPASSSDKRAAAGATVPASGARRWPAVAAFVVVLVVAGGIGYRYFLAQAAPSDSGQVAQDSVAPATSNAAPAGVATPPPPTSSIDSSALAAAPPSQPGASQANKKDSVPVSVPKQVASTPSGVTTKTGRSTADSARSVAPPAVVAPKPSAPAEDPVAVSELDSLSTVLRRGADEASARRIAGVLRGLSNRLTDPSQRARAYFRLIDASALSGDLTGACSALRGARGVARSAAQLTELRRYEEQLGCS